MKVIINRCYGGFGLSLIAQKMYLERKGQTPFFYKQTQYSFREGYYGFTKISEDKLEQESDMGMGHTTLKDLGEKFNLIGKDMHIPHGSSRKNLPTYYDYKEFCSWYYRNDPFSSDIRTDTDLIAVVEELGSKRASGQCSSLHIVDIPDDIKYEIDEYDGMETIKEIHRSWY